MTLTIRLVLVTLLMAGMPFALNGQSYPANFHAKAEVEQGNSAVTATFTIHLEALMHDMDFKTVSEALKYGGYPNFLPALRKLPPLGYVELAGTRTEIKYARVRAGDSHLVIGTDRPIFFVRGGAPDAKRKAGYELGIIELVLDEKGNGYGLMAAAARVKPGVDGSPLVDDYADTQIRLAVTTVK